MATNEYINIATVILRCKNLAGGCLYHHTAREKNLMLLFCEAAIVMGMLDVMHYIRQA